MAAVAALALGVLAAALVKLAGDSGPAPVAVTHTSPRPLRAAGDHRARRGTAATATHRHPHDDADSGEHDPGDDPHAHGDDDDADDCDHDAALPARRPARPTPATPQRRWKPPSGAR